jgi:hypothetical protein
MKFAEQDLERYSFLWSEARLIVAAVALFMGGVPPVLAFLPIPAIYVLLTAGLKLAWIISGLASAYLLYRWNRNNMMVFGGKKQADTVAFLVSAVSGVNLGITGLIGINIGMTISSFYPIFIVVAILYLGSSVYLYRRWDESGKKLFS